MSADLDTVALVTALNLVFEDCDKGYLSGQPKADLMFIHGLPKNLEDKALVAAAEIFHRGETKAIVINGLEVGEAASEYCGAAVIERKLHKLGVKTVFRIKSSVNTAEEVQGAIRFAHEMGCNVMYANSHRYHILRVMLQWKYYLRQSNSKIKVYARSIQDVDWGEIATKTILGGGVEHGTVLALFAAEIVRIARYSDLRCFDPLTGEKKYTPNATLEELLEYYSQRESN